MSRERSKYEILATTFCSWEKMHFLQYWGIHQKEIDAPSQVYLCTLWKENCQPCSYYSISSNSSGQLTNSEGGLYSDFLFFHVIVFLATLEEKWPPMMTLHLLLHCFVFCFLMSTFWPHNGSCLYLLFALMVLTYYQILNTFGSCLSSKQAKLCNTSGATKK